MDIIGRNQEIKELETLYTSPRSEFVVLYGRRRVGKTFLVNELFKDRVIFSHTALSPVELQGEEMMRKQLQHFTHSLVRHGAVIKCVPDNWLDAFYALEEYLEGKADGRRLVVFIDELPWLDTARSGFVTAFEAFWNGWGAKRSDLMLIVCGSAVSWISDRILNSKGGLFNRTTAEIKLRPFTLRECEDLFRMSGISMSRYDVMQSYMVFGGVPYYLNMFTRGRTLAQNIDRLVFETKAKLSNEFERLFASIFTNPAEAEKVVGLLSDKRGGYTREEILKKTGIGDGGNFTKLLRSLEESDFIRKVRPYKGKAKEDRYRLVDNFCLFHQYFLRKKSMDNESFWQQNQNSPSINSWRGLAFENVCFQHVRQIKAALGIAGVHTETYSWNGTGGQVDMVIDRADRLINLCECKFYSSVVAIDKDDDRKLRDRMTAFLENTGTKSALLMTLVTTYGLKDNEYSGIFQSVIISDDLFSV